VRRLNTDGIAPIIHAGDAHDQLQFTEGVGVSRCAANPYGRRRLNSPGASSGQRWTGVADDPCASTVPNGLRRKLMSKG
jgi:hypothetical protein